MCDNDVKSVEQPQYDIFLLPTRAPGGFFSSLQC